MRHCALLVAFLVSAALPAFATPQPRNATDIWYNPDEPGWGLNLIHQGDTLFASLFVYGPDGQSKWYYASNLTGDGTTYSGGLVENTGPAFSGPFDPALVRPRQVGTMTVTLGDTGGMVDYTVDGVHVTKAIARYTFRRTTLQGRYEGYMLQPAANGAAESGRTDLTLSITDTGSSFTMDTSSDSTAPCSYTGTPSQDGQYETVSGTYQCAGVTGAWAMRVDPTTEGFTGTFTGNGISGRIAAARATGDTPMQGFGLRNDLWFDPRESGWGVNIIEQGDTIFASLFVYDAQGRPRWYSASDLRQQNDLADGSVTYTGVLAESTGPYFGGTFSAAAVARRAVGQMTFQARPAEGTGSIIYSVDGVQVAKQVQRDTFRFESFSGSYLGSYAHDRQASMTIDDAGSNFQMQLSDRFGGSGNCTFTAPYSQSGKLRSMNGTFSCTSGESGPFTLQYATVSASGFTARFDAPRFNFGPLANGHLAGVRR